MKSAINWFEIPVTDMDRAAKFYSTIFDTELERKDFQGMPLTFFAYSDGGVGGALIKGPEMVPSREGTLIYLNGGHDLSPILERVWAAGGKVDTPKTFLNEEIGHIAVFEDSEGNRIGLHSPQ